MIPPRPWTILTRLALALAVAGCASSGGGKKSGAYYQDDGPDAKPPANLDQTPDATPRIEPYASGANRPYVVFGQRYVPDTSGQPYKRQGIASWYGKKFHGLPTSSGERYDMYAMTAAHTTLPIPSYARVTSLVNGKTIIVRVNDRGPFHGGRIMDLSYAAAYQLGLIGPGSGQVVVESISPDDIRRGAARHTPAAAGGVYLQAGAFSQSANAQSLRDRINTQPDANGAPAATVDQSGNLYRVRIGPYPDRQSALNAARRIADRIGITPGIAAREKARD